MLQRAMYVFFQAFRAAIVPFLGGFKSTLGAFGYVVGDLADMVSSLVFMDPRRGRATPPRPPEKTLEEKLDEIASELRRSGGRAQKLIDDAEALLDERARQVESAKLRTAELEAEVARTQARLDLLSQVQPEAAQAIKDVLGEDLDQRDKRSGRRDLVLFAMGIIVPIALTGLFKSFFG